MIGRDLSILKTCARCGRGFDGAGNEYCCPSCKKPKNAPRFLSSELTMRERQVIELVRQAKTNKEIASDLRLSEGTVKGYLVQIFAKLRVRNRTDLALWAAANVAAGRDVA